VNTAIVRPQGFPGAAEYFTQQPLESMGPILGRGGRFTVKDYVKDKLLSLQGVAQYIVEGCDAGDSALVVCHGSTTQLSIPIGAGSTHPVTVDALRRMNQALCQPGFDPFKKVMAELGVGNPNEALRFYRNILTMRDCLQLKHLGFRACRVGTDKDFLRHVCLLFWCQSSSAPKLRDFFARGRPSYYKTADFDKLVKKFPNTFYWGTAPNRVGLQGLVTKSHGALQFVAESVEAVRLFMKAKFGFATEAQYKRGEWVEMHGLWTEGAPPYFYFPSDRGYDANMETFHFDELLPPLYIPPEEEHAGGVRGLIERVRTRVRARRAAR
jgi:hypothetical protein